MSLLARLRAWRRRRAAERRARALVDGIFDRPDLLRGTSLRPRHRGRWVVLDHTEDEDGEVSEVRFGIVRHPRPYAFSRQHHEVAEFWVYRPQEESLERVAGLNLTRRRGLDAAD